MMTIDTFVRSCRTGYGASNRKASGRFDWLCREQIAIHCAADTWANRIGNGYGSVASHTKKGIHHGGSGARRIGRDLYEEIYERMVLQEGPPLPPLTNRSRKSGIGDPCNQAWCHSRAYRQARICVNLSSESPYLRGQSPCTYSGKVSNAIGAWDVGNASKRKCLDANVGACGMVVDMDILHV